MNARPVVPGGIAALLGEAVTLHRQGRLAPAEKLYRKVLAIAPHNFDALQLLGGLAYQKEHFAEADRLLEKAVTVKPQDAGALYNRGNVLKKLGRLEPALACFDRVLVTNPGHPESLNDRGNVLQTLGRLDEALESYDRAIAARPAYVNALYNRANTLRALRRLPQSIADCGRVLAMAPNHADALNALGAALADARRFDEALASYDRALAADRHNVHAAFNRGIVLSELKRFDEAAQAFAMVLRLQPKYEYALGSCFRAQLQTCDWRAYDRTTAQLCGDVRAGRRVDIPFFFLSYGGSSADEQHCAATLAAHRYPPERPAIWNGTLYRHERIRVGYFSGDFRNHPSAYPMARRLETHDRARFEISAFSFGPDTGDEMRKRIEAGVDRFIDVRETADRDVASLIAKYEIDILVDLTGHAADGRPGVLAWRGAPVQASYLGYSSTMGADYVDYILADRHIVPSTDQPYYAEKLVHLPGCFLPFDAEEAAETQAPTRAGAALPDQGFVFCAFSNGYKLNPALFDVWMNLLKGVPGSVLWLLQENTGATANLCREAERRGVAAERLVFAGRVPARADHLARHALADLFLDTLPYNAHSTGRDALWAGLPVLTCTGNSFASRVGASLLHAVGLPDLITGSLADYEARGLHLARSREELAALRARLMAARTTSMLFDKDDGRRNMEAAFVEMWQRQQRGDAPAAFSVGQPAAAR